MNTENHLKLPVQNVSINYLHIYSSKLFTIEHPQKIESQSQASLLKMLECKMSKSFGTVNSVNSVLTLSVLEANK